MSATPLPQPEALALVDSMKAALNDKGLSGDHLDRLRATLVALFEDRERLDSRRIKVPMHDDFGNTHRLFLECDLRKMIDDARPFATGIGDAQCAANTK